MTSKQKIWQYQSLNRLVVRLRDDFRSGQKNFVLLYAYNSTGKTRLSMEFKEAGKRKNAQRPDTLYFNAFTQDLFTWDNDLVEDSRRVLRLNSDSRFFAGLSELALDVSIQSYLGRYTDIKFDIDYTNWTISFSKGEATNIKVARGEENLFILCLFMAICERVIDGHASYAWVKYIYIDDPISSLDDNNAIAVASDLSGLLRKARGRIKVVVSSHHALFFNVVFHELKSEECKCYFLHRPSGGTLYTLRSTEDTPFFHHIAMLSELQKAADSGELYTYHFNMLRSILEKTASFFGKKDFSECLEGLDDEALYSRALNLLSHGRYSLYEPARMQDDNKALFREILTAFLGKHSFELPDLHSEQVPPSGDAMTVPTNPSTTP